MLWWAINRSIGVLSFNLIDWFDWFFSLEYGIIFDITRKPNKE
ncbi:hypothetical protein NTHI1209_01723 [Haemophilus influenzae]|uniref:Uncharacterized protein n=1 Tax=Haemophilus influenzae TaxID=727 RepID=A0A158SYY9_HAEIF|nr:hypothetical protein NTHI1209_01723 [Haemophilus influenzae]